MLPCVSGIPPSSTSSVHWVQKVLLSLSIGEGHSVCSVYRATVCVSREGDSTLGVTCLCTLCTKVASYCYIGMRVEPNNVEFFEMRDV